MTSFSTGKHEGFQMNEDGRIKAMLLRLQDRGQPVSEEFRGMFADFLSGKTNKVVKLAEQDGNAAYVRTLLEVGTIDGANRKRVKKQLAASELAERQKLAGELDWEPPAAPVTAGDGEGVVEQKYLDRLRKVNARSVLLKYGVQTLPPVHLAGEGAELAPPEYLELCLAEYLKQQSKWSAALCPLADEAAAKLDRDELVQTLLSLYEHTEPESLRRQRKKTVKSLPKKGADPEKYEAAKADFSEMKKNMKKAAKARCDQLFQNFLSGREMDGTVWAESNLGNPLLRQTASLLVWSQEGRTFTLQEGQPVDSQGRPYALTVAPIRVAHPMEMGRDDLERWQRYFTSHGLKQPFAQVWEPVIDFSQVKEDRYQDIEIPAYRFKKQEKHGIELKIDLSRYDASVSLTDCWLWVDGNALFDDLFGYSLDNSVTLQKFECRKESRAANHIIGLLDKWTVYGRILKDDVSVVEYLDAFTLAQVRELLNLAIEHNCTSCTAALLE